VRSRSIRRRITILAAAIATVVLLAAAVVVVFVVQTQLRQNLDRSLEQRADQIEQAVGPDPSTELLNSNREDRFAQVLDAGGVVLVSSANVSGVPALASLPIGRTAVTTRSDLPLEDDAYRVLISRFDTPAGVQFVVVGENIDDVRDGVRALIVTLSIVFPTAVIVLVASVWWLVGRTLRPVEEIRRDVAGIELGDLSRRVPEPGSGDEIDRLAATMNSMLARLESASAGQRQFVADVSHELRTPLTRIRTALEVELASGSTDSEATVKSVLQDSIEMQELVDGLLFLARRDGGAGDVRRRPIDLDVVVGAEVLRARQETDIQIDAAGVDAVVVDANEGDLGRLVANLISNAVRHAAGKVVVAATELEGSAIITVDDDGPGIPEHERERVFERFVRLDESRHRAGGGTGLGLAIARDVAESHGGSIEVERSTLGGARFVVRLG